MPGSTGKGGFTMRLSEHVLLAGLGKAGTPRCFTCLMFCQVLEVTSETTAPKRTFQELLASVPSDISRERQEALRGEVEAARELVSAAEAKVDGAREQLKKAEARLEELGERLKTARAEVKRSRV